MSEYSFALFNPSNLKAIWAPSANKTQMLDCTQIPSKICVSFYGVNLCEDCYPYRDYYYQPIFSKKVNDVFQLDYVSAGYWRKQISSAFRIHGGWSNCNEWNEPGVYVITVDLRTPGGEFVDFTVGGVWGNCKIFHASILPTDIILCGAGNTYPNNYTTCGPFSPDLMSRLKVCYGGYVYIAGLFKIRPDWILNYNYLIGFIVTGSDGNKYRAKSSHLSSGDTRPVWGPNYTTYWEQITVCL